MADETKKTTADLFADTRQALQDIKASGVLDPAEPDTTDKDTITTLDEMEEAKGILSGLIADDYGASDEVKIKYQHILDSLNKVTDALFKGEITPIYADINGRLLYHLHNFTKELEQLKEPLKEWEQVQPFIEAELKKPEYGGKTFDEIAEESDNGNIGIIPGSLLDKLLKAAYQAMDNEAARQDLIKRQNAGRAERQAQYAAAKASNAIMEMKGGNYPLPSAPELWEAFSPSRITKMGTLKPDDISKETGLVLKTELADGDTEPLNAPDVPIQAYLLLNAVYGNSIEDYYSEYVKDGTLRFYVKSVIDTMQLDPRGAFYGTDNTEQLSFLDSNNKYDAGTINRKTAGAIYLEELFKPLLGYIGLLPNGSRYSIFSYEGYDYETDTMAIRSPYIYQLWRLTQGAYLDREKVQEARRLEGKRPTKDSLKPLELNNLFKGPAIKEDAITLEIANYITNCMLNAGKEKKDSTKHSRLDYGSIINNCPTLKYRLTEIDNMPDKVTRFQKEKDKNGNLITTNNLILDEHGQPKEFKTNKAAFVNAELKKFKNAFTLVMDREKCDATKRFNFLRFETISNDADTPKLLKETARRIDAANDAGKEYVLPEYKPITKRDIKRCRLYIEWTTNKV